MKVQGLTHQPLTPNQSLSMSTKGASEGKKGNPCTRQERESEQEALEEDVSLLFSARVIDGSL